MKLIDRESIAVLSEKLKNDIEAIQLIQDCLQSFADYANRIYQLELYQMLFGFN